MTLVVTKDAWPHADLAIRSSYECPLIDGLSADKVKASDEREIREMKELQLYSCQRDGGPLLYAAWFDLRVETGELVCAFMQADTSSETCARPPKGQERESWCDERHAYSKP